MFQELAHNIVSDALPRLTNRVFAAENDLDVLYEWRREAAADIRSVNSSQGAFATAAEKQMTAAERRLSDVREAFDEMDRNLESWVTRVYHQGGFIHSWSTYPMTTLYFTWSDSCLVHFRKAGRISERAERVREGCNMCTEID